MWLVQLYKANDNATIDGVYSTNSCDTNYINNYIDPDDYVHELSLCNTWDYATKKGILIFKKRPEEITFDPLQNERFMFYYFIISYNSSNSYCYIYSLEYLENTDFFIDFYVSPEIYFQFSIPDAILADPNPIMSFLRYIKGKTLKIGIMGNEIPKYSIVFDDNCKYYYYNNPNRDYITIFAIKKPFLVGMYLSPVQNLFFMTIHIKPRLIEEFNDYNITQSAYNPDNDQPIKVDDIIGRYFNSNTKEGVSYNDVNIDDDSDNFSYSLIRALLGTFKQDITDNYYVMLDTDMYVLSELYGSYMELSETPLCIYFPLFRPQLDNNGFNKIWPQYNPNDTSEYVYSFDLSISLNSNGEVLYSSLFMRYGASLYNANDCLAYSDPAGYMPAWRSAICDFTLPFRFLGASGCEATDDWNNDTIRHNANYLFRIVKPSLSGSSTSTYNIKGVGCGELTTDITRFSDFSANSEFQNDLYKYEQDEVQRITVSESGYPIGAISNKLGSYGVRNNEACFVLFDESLVENAADFLSIYQAVTAPLPDAIVCYVGDSEKIPNTHKNKVIHSDAIVTDLDTNEQMPLVIKYIRYAKRLHKLFNG